MYQWSRDSFEDSLENQKGSHSVENKEKKIRSTIDDS
jgi:hypothetical protein